MKILFCQGGERWKKTKLGNHYTSGSFDERIWQRYRNYGSSLTVMFAKENDIYSDTDAKSKFNFFDESKYNAIELIDIYRPRIQALNYMARLTNKKKIWRAVEDADVVIIRSLGTYVTDETFRIAYSKKKKIITEVTGPIFEGNYYGGVLSRACSVFRELQAKRYNRLSKYTLYVTQFALQKRYPNRGIRVGVSDVFLSTISFESIDIRKKKIKNSVRKFGTAGSVSLGRKGHKYVIKALGVLKRKGIENIEYHMIGGGNVEVIENLAKKEGVLDMVYFDGTLPADRMPTWYDDMDVYICASMAEGLCRSVVEAMSRACAVICTNVCGNVELADDDFLYEKRDYKKLAELIEKMLDTTICIKQCERSLLKAREFDKERLDKERDGFYLNAIADE